MKSVATHYKRRMERAGLCYSARTDSRIAAKARNQRTLDACRVVSIDGDGNTLKEAGEELSQFGPNVLPAAVIGEFLADVDQVIDRSKQAVTVFDALGDAGKDDAKTTADGLGMADGFIAGHGELSPSEKAASVGADL